MAKLAAEAAKLIKGYKSLALVQIYLCICFILAPGGDLHGELYGYVHFAAAWFIMAMSIIAYFRQWRWVLWAIFAGHCVTLVFNIPYFLVRDTLISAGRVIVAFDITMIVACMHFLGKGVR